MNSLKYVYKWNPFLKLCGLSQRKCEMYVHKKPDAADGKEWVTITQFSE